MRSRCIIFVVCLTSSLVAGSARAQETDVRAAVSETLAALVSGDAANFVSFRCQSREKKFGIGRVHTENEVRGRLVRRQKDSAEQGTRRSVIGGDRADVRHTLHFRKRRRPRPPIEGEEVRGRWRPH